MANQSDDITELSRAVAGLYRIAYPLFSAAPQFGKAAKAAGLSAAQVKQFLDGEFDPPPRQSVALINSLLAQTAATRASSLKGIRFSRPLPASESTTAGAEAAAAAIEKDFPPWRVMIDGLARIGSDNPGKLIWRAAHPEGLWPDVSGVDAHELRDKLTRIEEHRAKAAEQERAYFSGAGITRRTRR